MEKTLNIQLYAEAASEILGISVQKLVNLKNNFKIKYVIFYAVEFGFSITEVLKFFNRSRSYFIVTKKNNSQMIYDLEYLKFCNELQIKYEEKLSGYSEIEKSINLNNTIANKLRDELLKSKEINKKLQYQANKLNTENKKLKDELENISKELSNNLTKNLRIIIAEYYYKDESDFNAKHIIEKLAADFFPDMPINKFERKQNFYNFLKQYKKDE